LMVSCPRLTSAVALVWVAQITSAPLSSRCLRCEEAVVAMTGWGA
jgi:hypothetical protein